MKQNTKDTLRYFILFAFGFFIGSQIFELLKDYNYPMFCCIVLTLITIILSGKVSDLKNKIDVLEKTNKEL